MNKHTEMVQDALIEAGDHALDVIEALKEAYARTYDDGSDDITRTAVLNALALVRRAQDILGDEVVRLSQRGE